MKFFVQNAGGGFEISEDSDNVNYDIVPQITPPPQ